MTPPVFYRPYNAGYADQVLGTDFAKSGRLATASLDGFIEHYRAGVHAAMKQRSIVVAGAGECAGENAFVLLEQIRRLTREMLNDAV